MKHIFVGDIHGKVDAVKQALDASGHKVFVGDFCDSFDKTVPEHEECITLVLDAIEKKEATALFGNHELSYLLPSKHRCSGYNRSMEDMLIPHISKIRSLFKPFLEIGENWLVTHAGAHPDVVTKMDSNWEEEFSRLESPIHWIGRYRGGRYPVGGFFWCDFNAEFEPIENLNQIFGHSRAKTYDIRTMKGNNSINYCIDCLDTQFKFLELDL